MARIVILAGRGRYEDPWHDHAATSHEVAQLLREVTHGGSRVEVRGLFPDTLDDASDVALVVVNSGDGRTDPDFDGDDGRWAPFHARLDALARAGAGVLALHQAANTFADSPTWERILGGRWIPGESYHPPIGEATIRVTLPPHPITAGLDDIRLFDERYCLLRTGQHTRVLATHHEAGTDHPVVWVNEHDGVRCVYDALGHDVRAFRSAGRRDLLRREARWLLDGGAAAGGGSQPA